MVININWDMYRICLRILEIMHIFQESPFLGDYQETLLGCWKKVSFFRESSGFQHTEEASRPSGFQSLPDNKWYFEWFV